MTQLLVHRLPDFLMVVVAAWLGLGLLVRAPHNRVFRAFAFFCVHMALYGITAIQYQLTTSPAVADVLGRAELVATALAPPSFLLFIIALTTSGRIKPAHTWFFTLFYATGLMLAAYAIFGNLPQPVAQTLPWTQWQEPRFPDGIINWASTAQRVIPLFVALFLMWNAYWRKPDVTYTMQLRRILWVSAVLGVIGAVTATAAREFSQSPALPRTLIVIALLIFTYTVLSQRGLLSARATQRAFVYSVLGSLFTMLYVGLVMFLEWGAGELLHINIPLVSALSIVGIAAAFGPLGEWLRSQMDRRFYPREFDYSQLLKSLSDELFERGDLTEQLQSGLAWVCRMLDVQAGVIAIATRDGLLVRSVYGNEQEVTLLPDVQVPDQTEECEETWEPLPFVKTVIPLRHSDKPLGILGLGERKAVYTDKETYSVAERALLDYLGNYFALTIDHAHVRDEHRKLMVTLNEQSKTLRLQQEQLAQQAAETKGLADVPQQKETSPPGTLRVHALGSLRAERDNGDVITRWGGDKAGTYQAEALFAFLFDRRGKGITKDEAGEMVWPDLEIARADSAFHRTLAALRRTLEPGLRRGNLSKIITYHHERYWLEPSAIAWSDVEEFINQSELATTLYHNNEHDAALEALETANKLYRGDYMDDCPFFGDSSYVEDQRTPLRARYIEVQVLLGNLYETKGRLGEAATVYRHALTLSLDDCPPAADGLARVQDFLTS